MAESKAAGLGPNERFIGVKGARLSLNTPALLLDLDALDRNIAAMAAHAKAAGINLRPHAKGAKSVEIGRRQVAAGGPSSLGGVASTRIAPFAIYRLNSGSNVSEMANDT